MRMQVNRRNRNPQTPEKRDQFLPADVVSLFSVAHQGNRRRDGQGRSNNDFPLASACFCLLELNWQHLLGRLKLTKEGVLGWCLDSVLQAV